MEMRITRWRPIGEILVESGAITVDDLHRALAEQSHTGRKLGEVLIEAGLVSWLTLAQAIAEQSEAIDLDRPRVVEAAAPAPVPEPTPEPQPAPEPVQYSSSVPERFQGDQTRKLETIEAMLRDRQRAFFELVTATEKLRQRVTFLEEELAARDVELARLRANSAA
jgi:hypothetical protein